MAGEIKKIYLVRHGQVENPKKIFYGYLPLPLSEAGKNQAKKAGEFLKDKDIGAIFSSPLARAKETAEIINQAACSSGLDIKIIDDLRENAFGLICEGYTKAQAFKRFPLLLLLYHLMPAQTSAGEKPSDMSARMKQAVFNAITDNPGRNLVFVSHKDPLAALLLKLTGKSLNLLHFVICEPGSVWELEIGDNKIVNKKYWKP